MIPPSELLLFALAALLLVISPGPNMIYLISRSVSQGRKAGMISLAGVISGFLFHIVMVSFGLTALLMAVPFAYTALKIMGVLYLLFLAYQAVKKGNTQFTEFKNDFAEDHPAKLFRIGFLTNVLNPKVAVFYLSFFPQFIHQEYGSVLPQSFLLGAVQVIVSFSINLLIVLTASRVARFLIEKPFWAKIQRWFMASVLTGLAIKMAFTKAK